MFVYEITAFGKFTKHSISNPKTGDSFSLVPERSAVLLSLILDGVEILDGYQTAQEVINDNWSKSRILYPFPNRLKDGHLHWEGTDYQWPLSDELRENALHGFSSNRPFYVDASEAEETGKITCIYQYDGEEEYYPFPFELRVTYSLAGDHQFGVDISISNQGDISIPVGIGWHPYFKLSDNVRDSGLQCPPMSLIGVDARMIPTGKHYEYDLFLQRRNIGEEVLDNCFLLTEQKDISELWLWGNGHQLRYWQESKDGLYNYIQLFTPPHRESIAIEPMTCNVNAYHNGDGLTILTPKQSLAARCGLELTTNVE